MPLIHQSYQSPEGSRVQLRWAAALLGEAEGPQGRSIPAWLRPPHPAMLAPSPCQPCTVPLPPVAPQFSRPLAVAQGALRPQLPWDRGGSSPGAPTLWAAVLCSPPGVSGAGARLSRGDGPGGAAPLGPNPAAGQQGAEAVHPAARVQVLVTVLHPSPGTQWVFQPSRGTEHGPSVGPSCVALPAPVASWQRGAPRGAHRPAGMPGLQTAASPATPGVPGVLGRQIGVGT